MATPEPPYGPSSVHIIVGGKPVRVHHLVSAKKDDTKPVILTAYDAVTARILDAAGTNLLLVDDFTGSVMLRHDSAFPVKLDEMVVATRSMARTAKCALVATDLPSGTHEASPEQALASAVRLMKAGANTIKLEGDTPRATSVRTLTQAGIPMAGHLGFAPQNVNMPGGFRVQGCGEAADVLMVDAQALVEAGAVAPVLEMVPEPLVAHVTESLTIPTIGIGADTHCDGQVLVWMDITGMTDWSPHFAHQLGQVSETLRQAVVDYGAAVHEESFPAGRHWFSS